MEINRNSKARHIQIHPQNSSQNPEQRRPLVSGYKQLKLVSAVVLQNAYGTLSRNSFLKRQCRNVERLTQVCKSTPVTGHAGPEGSRKLRLLDFLTTAQYGGRLSALRNGRLYPQGYSWYSFYTSVYDALIMVTEAGFDVSQARSVVEMALF